MHEDLLPTEVDLVGQWLPDTNGVEADAVCARIEWLTRERLERLGSDDTGWETLSCDPRDGRLWELTYPQGETHGGGAPRLTTITQEAAAAKYRLRTS